MAFGIVLCYCPRNHTIYHCTFDNSKVSMSDAVDVLNAALEDAIARDVLKPWCKRCGARKQQWEFEARVTKYQDQLQLMCAIDELKKRNAEEALRLM